jgi:hypothetical protein
VKKQWYCNTADGTAARNEIEERGGTVFMINTSPGPFPSWVVTWYTEEAG